MAILGNFTATALFTTPFTLVVVIPLSNRIGLPNVVKLLGTTLTKKNRNLSCSQPVTIHNFEHSRKLPDPQTRFLRPFFMCLISTNQFRMCFSHPLSNFSVALDLSLLPVFNGIFQHFNPLQSFHWFFF